MQNRLYQLIISRLDGEKLFSPLYQEKVYELVSKGIGGFILFGGEREEVRAFINEIQSASDATLFIASDIERGVGQQIKGYTDFPCQMAVRAAIQRERPEGVSPLLHDVIQAIASEAIDAGINMPLIPVLDVNQRPDNPIICTRAFSDNPADATWFGSEYIKALEGSGLISCAKHFPGHGDTSIDSHISLPVISKSYEELMDTDIMPFAEAVKAGVSSIMTGHLLVPAIDSMPATLSEKVIKGLLREKLGFDGLIITDALNMSALKDIDNIHARCIKAGADILLHPADADEAVKDLENALKTKEIDEASIDRAIERVLKFKSKLRQIKKRPGTDLKFAPLLATRITEASITVVKQKEGLLPITDAHVILAGTDRFHEPTLWKSYFRDVSTIHDSLLLPSFEKSPFYSPFAKGGQGGLSGEPIIFAIFTEVSAWKGSSGIGDEDKQRIIELIKRAKRSIVISLGSPYILSHFKDADMLIAAYGATTDAQKAVIKCLKEEINFKGELPVKLNLT